MKPILAKEYEGQDISGWMMSEKYDGVRAIWDGENFISRNGLVINCPSEVKTNMPREVLDGELWLGRGQFQAVLTLVKLTNPTPLQWSDVRYMVYDAPTKRGGLQERLAGLEVSGIVEIATQTICIDLDHASEFYRDLIKGGAEGTIYRKPTSLYKSGRSEFFLKDKPLSSDEAKVIGFGFGMKSVLLEWAGKTFKLPTFGNRCEIGAFVTFTFSGLTDAGLPKCAAFSCVRDYE